MAAFVLFIRTYAVWIYLLLVLGIFFGIKILVDAQRLSRTTLFSLDQERATEQVYRALILIGVLLLAMFAVTGIVLFVAPMAPPQEGPILRGPTATLPPVIFPTSTAIPTATSTSIPATETPFVTTAPTQPSPTRTATRPLAPPVGAATATSVFGLPAPVILGPIPNGVVVTGESRANNDLRFQWIWFCDQCKLGPEDRFVVTVSFVDKTSGGTRFVGGGTQTNFLTMGDILRGAGMEVWHQAKDDAFQWNVQVKRGEQPLSPPSETWKFVWH